MQKEFGKLVTDDDIPLTIPLLDYLCSHLGFEERKPFLGQRILAVQHLLGSSLPFFSMLEKGGAKPEDIFIVGKAYSSHPEVVHHLINRGYRISFDDVFAYTEDKPYDSVLEEHIEASCRQMLEEMPARADAKGIIIDDGGKAIKLIHEVYPDKLNRFTCVEQTSRGARLLSGLHLLVPVINVARSEAKTMHESSSIAHAMVRQLLNSLHRWEQAGVLQIRDNNILLLGHGYIGECVAKELTMCGFNIAVFDPDQNRIQHIAESLNMHVVFNRPNAYDSAGIIVGCSGLPSIPREEFKDISSGTLLVNMASTDTEFSAWDFRRKANIVHQHILPHDLLYLHDFLPLPWRSLYRVQEGGHYFYIANGGFPIDFSGDINPVPLCNIQLTPALLLGAAVQSVQTEEAGMIELDAALQQEVVSEYLKLQTL